MSVTISLSNNPPNVKQINIDANGRTFSYQLTVVTERCIVITADHTGAVKQFTSREAVGAFLRELEAHLQNKYQPKQLPAPKIAGLLPPVAGLMPGQCEGYLNAHWSPLASDGWVFERRGHKYCPHCFTSFHKSMSYMQAQKTKEQQNTMGNQPNSPIGQVVDVYLNEEGENCEYCSHPIKQVYTIRLGDRQMNVGSECVRHLCSTQETAVADIIARRIKRAETQWRKKYPAPRDNETRKQYIERRLTEIKNALAAHKAYTALRVDHNVARRINARACRIYKLAFTSNPYWEPFGNRALTERRIQRIERRFKANRYDFIRPIWDVRDL